MPRSVSVLGGLFSGSKISIVPFSTVVRCGTSENFGNGNIRSMLHEPSGRCVAWIVGRRTEDARNLRLAFDELGKAGLAEHHQLVEIGQFALRAGGMRIQQCQPANLDPFAIDQLGRADFHLQSLVMPLPQREHMLANLIVHAAIEIEPQPNGSHERGQHAPLEREPTGVDQVFEDDRGSLATDDAVAGWWFEFTLQRAEAQRRAFATESRATRAPLRGRGFYGENWGVWYAVPLSPVKAG